MAELTSLLAAFGTVGFESWQTLHPHTRNT